MVQQHSHSRNIGLFNACGFQTTASIIFVQFSVDIPISDEQGEGVLNIFYGIGDMYSNLEEYMDIYEGRLPSGFIPIGNDPSGNVICLGLNEKYCNNIYFWDHEQESDNPDDMSNMFFLASDLNEFLNSLYDEKGE